MKMILGFCGVAAGERPPRRQKIAKNMGMRFISSQSRPRSFRRGVFVERQFHGEERAGCLLQVEVPNLDTVGTSHKRAEWNGIELKCVARGITLVPGHGRKQLRAVVFARR